MLTGVPLWLCTCVSCGMCRVAHTSRRHYSRSTCKVHAAPLHTQPPCIPLACPFDSHPSAAVLLCPGVHAAVIVADLTDLRSFVDIGRWTAHFASSATSALPFPVLLLANKADSSDRVLSDTSVAEWADRHRLTQSYVVSARTGAGVEEAFRSIVARVDGFVPAAPTGVSGGGGSMDATQRLLSLLHSSAAARRSPSHSPSPSHRPSASLTPTSRTRASSLLSTLPLPAGSRVPLAASSPRTAAGGVGRSPAQSYSALTVQRLTAAGPHRSAGPGYSTLGRPEARERDSSRSGSRVEEKEWVVERKLFTAASATTPIYTMRPSLTGLRAASTAGDGTPVARSALHTPSARVVDLRF